MMVDTLRLDSAQVEAFRHDGRYDYDRELIGGSQSLLDWLSEVVSEWINETFNVVLDSDLTYWLLIVLGVLVVVFVAWLYWRYNPQLFVRGEKDGAIDYDVTEDTIYGVDFDKGIKEALTASDYRQAVRLLYLQTLLHLQNAERIDWQPSSTPAQYMRQAAIEPFYSMSRHFIKVRYGNFEATPELFDRMKALQADVIKETPTQSTPQPPNSQPIRKEGGHE